MKYLYLAVDFCTILVPFVYSFHPKIQFHHQFRAVWPAILLTAVPFLVWDFIFTEKGVWGFTPDYLLGIQPGNLPLEEVLFFICIPYACLFTYFCLTRFFRLEWKSRTEKGIGLVLATLFLAIGLANLEKAYTATTFISTALVLLVLLYRIKEPWLGGVVITYAILLLPFSIVNGILTGTGLEQPVVWYNNAENLGLRLSTIPIEDVFYGFELFLVNVFFFRRWKKAENGLVGE